MIPVPVGAAGSVWARILGAPSQRWQSWAPGEADFPQRCRQLVLTQSHCCLLLSFALYIICSLAPFQTYLAIVTAEDIYTAGVWNNTENLWSWRPDSHTIPGLGAGNGPPWFCRAPGQGWVGFSLASPPQPCLCIPGACAMGQVGGTKHPTPAGSLTPAPAQRLTIRL